MLRSAREILSYHLLATDGKIGEVKDFLFDDREWKVWYVVADTRRWLPGRLVLLAPADIGSPNYQDSTLAVALSQDKIKDSPLLNFDRPVSRQKEAELHRYYGWPAYWVPPPPPGGMPPMPPSSPDPSIRAHQEQEGDPHLRSVREVHDYKVKANDGESGVVADLIIDFDTWNIRHLVIDPRRWTSGTTVLVPTESVRSVSWDESSVHLNCTRTDLEHSPEYDPKKPVNVEHHVYYTDFRGKPADRRM